MHLAPLTNCDERLQRMDQKFQRYKTIIRNSHNATILENTRCIIPSIDRIIEFRTRTHS